jgi:hypothetical protein
LNSGFGGHIDFHFGGSADFTSRIIEDVSGTVAVYPHLKVAGNLSVGGDPALP